MSYRYVAANQKEEYAFSGCWRIFYAGKHNTRYGGQKCGKRLSENASLNDADKHDADKHDADLHSITAGPITLEHIR
jgi:hypothetical protein